MVVILFFIAFKLCKSHIIPSQNCIDPEDAVLEQQLMTYKIEFFKNTSQLLSYSNNASSAKDREENNSECDEASRNKTIIKEKSVCPYKIIQVKVENMFPAEISTAQCTCPYCSTKLITRNDMSCMPFKQVIPVLIRTNLTQTSGYCEWIRETTVINTNCFCAFNQEIIIRL
jgi:hypothetical protein